MSLASCRAGRSQPVAEAEVALKNATPASTPRAVLEKGGLLGEEAGEVRDA